MQISWEIFGAQITIQLAGQVDEDEYMAFGLSGSNTQSQMLGSDVAIAFVDGHRGFATDYNITALTPVSEQINRLNEVVNINIFVHSVLKFLDNTKVFVKTILSEVKTAISCLQR